MYSNHFVLAVLVNGQPVKELSNGTVSIPFGTEYSLRFRNKNNRRAVVKIYIDGENVSSGGYVIGANSSIDIKRHEGVDRAFKFVSLDSAEAVDFGKNGPNPDKIKGTIEARFYLEKEYRPIVTYPIVEEHHHHHHHDHYHPKPWPTPVYPPYQPPYKPWQPFWCSTNTSGTVTARGMSGAGGSSCSAGEPTLSFNDSLEKGVVSQDANYSCDALRSVESRTVKTQSMQQPLQDGCTVEGQSTGQNFYSTYVDLEDTYTSLKVFLQGYSDSTNYVETAVERPRRRKTNKDRVIDDLEQENEKLRKKLAEAENKRLKEKLKELE